MEVKQKSKKELEKERIRAEKAHAALLRREYKKLVTKFRDCKKNLGNEAYVIQINHLKLYPQLAKPHKYFEPSKVVSAAFEANKPKED